MRGFNAFHPTIRHRIGPPVVVGAKYVCYEGDMPMKHGRRLSIAPAMRWLCEISVVIVALALSRGVAEPVQLPKATIVAVVAAAIASIHLLAVMRRWEFHLPPRWFSIAVGAFTTAIVLAALFSESSGPSHGR